MQLYSFSEIAWRLQSTKDPAKDRIYASVGKGSSKLAAFEHLVPRREKVSEYATPRSGPGNATSSKVNDGDKEGPFRDIDDGASPHLKSPTRISPEDFIGYVEKKKECGTSSICEWNTFAAIFPVRSTSGEHKTLSESEALPETRDEFDGIKDWLSKAKCTSYPETFRSSVYSQREFIAMLRKYPRLMHFTGHGSKEYLAIDKTKSTLGSLGESNVAGVSKSSNFFFAGIIESQKVSSLECVFLNCCHSSYLGKLLSAHVPYVVCWKGMEARSAKGGGKILSKDAYAFAMIFYEILSGEIRDSGEKTDRWDFEKVFKQAVVWANSHETHKFDVKKWRPWLFINEALRDLHERRHPIRNNSTKRDAAAQLDESVSRRIQASLHHASGARTEMNESDIERYLASSLSKNKNIDLERQKEYIKMLAPRRDLILKVTYQTTNYKVKASVSSIDDLRIHISGKIRVPSIGKLEFFDDDFEEWLVLPSLDEIPPKARLRAHPSCHEGEK